MLVVDDGSPEAIVSRTAQAFQAEVLRLESRRGFCVACNAGVQQARGEVVQLLNDDTEVCAGWVQAALQPFANARIAAVSPLVLLGPPGTHCPERIDSAGDIYYRAGFAAKRWHGRSIAPKYLQSAEVFGASGSAAFFRRDAFLRVGGLPEEFTAYFDDVDLSFRLRRAGYRIWYEPASRVYHRVHSSYGRPHDDLLAQQSRNEELVFWRNLTAGELIWAVPMHLCVLIAKAMRRLAEGQLSPWLRGRWQALSCWRAILYHRHRLARREFQSLIFTDCRSAKMVRTSLEPEIALAQESPGLIFSEGSSTIGTKVRVQVNHRKEFTHDFASDTAISAVANQSYR